MSDKDFKVKNKLQVKGITSAGPVLSDASGNLDSTAYITTAYGGTGTSTSPASGQILYSSSGATYAPTDLSSLVIPTSFSADAPSSPVVGQVWIESDSDATAFDTNIIRRQAFTATAGQTEFTTSVTFIDGYEQVFYNGVLLLRTTDYTTSNSNTITLVSAAAVNDIIEVITVTNLNSVNTYTQAEIESGYVSKSGGSTVTASGSTVKPLIIKGAASQTANLQEWQDSSGTVLARIFPNGKFETAGDLQVNAASRQGTTATAGWNTFATQSNSFASIGVRAMASQTADLQQWQDSAGTVLTKVNSIGRMTINSTTDAGGAALYVIQPNGGYGVRVLGAGTTGAALWVDTVAGGVGAIIRGAASQTANLQEWQNSAGTILSRIGSDGRGAFNRVGIGTSTATEYLAVIGGNAAVTTSYIRGAASQTADLQQWQDSSGTVLAGIGPNGRIYAQGKAGNTDDLLYLRRADNGVNMYVDKDATLRGNFSIRLNQEPTIDTQAYMWSGTAARSALGVSGTNSTNPTFYVKGTASQTSNLTEWQNSSGTILSAVNASGGLELNGKDVEIMNIMGAY